VDGLGIPHVIALVNPRAYFLALAAAAAECAMLDRLVLFRVPAHPRYLRQAVRTVAAVVRHTIEGARMPGGIVGTRAFLPALRGECARYRDALPAPWGMFVTLPRRLIRVRPATAVRG
jgi:hypothetical protein